MDIYWNIFTGVLFMERDTVSLNIEAKNNRNQNCCTYLICNKLRTFHSELKFPQQFG